MAKYIADKGFYKEKDSIKRIAAYLQEGDTLVIHSEHLRN